MTERMAARRERVSGWVLVALLSALVMGCAGSELTAEARGIRGLIRQAREAGAYRCAPGELALAESHVDFADRELEEGEYLRARDDLRIAGWNAREALRLSPLGRCARDQARGRGRGDSDKDGIPDAVDKCPYDPEDKDGTEDDDGCPDVDDDKDGVLDVTDRCPHAAEDLDGFKDEDGCPDDDNDGDGIDDKHDRCPDRSEDKDGFEDEDGCPDLDDDRDGIADLEDKCPRKPGARADGGCPRKFSYIRVTAEKIELRQTIAFASAAPVIQKKSYPLLDEVASVLRARPTVKVRIEGHTDSRGKRETNLQLSQARADAVKAYLVGSGIALDRLEATGFGPDQPIETNKTAAGRERNRRVEFVILSP